MIDFYCNLPTSGKVAWAVLTMVLLISIIRIFLNKAQKGGIGAGIVLGVIMKAFLESVTENGGIIWWQQLKAYVRIPIVILLSFIIIAICAVMITRSQEWMSKRRNSIGIIILSVFSGLFQLPGFPCLHYLQSKRSGTAVLFFTNKQENISSLSAILLVTRRRGRFAMGLFDVFKKTVSEMPRPNLSRYFVTLCPRKREFFVVHGIKSIITFPTGD